MIQLSKQKHFVVLVAVAFLLGCAPPPMALTDIFTAPKPGHSPSAPTVQQIMWHLDCELEQSVNGSDIFFALTRYQFLAQATLTLEVTDNEGFNPSLSFINPYVTPMTNSTWTIGGQLNGTQDRIISTTVLIDLAQLSHKGHDKIDSGQKCPLTNERAVAAGFKLKDSTAIEGDLGLPEAIQDGLSALDANGPLGAAGPVGKLSNNPTTFTSQVFFTVVEGMNVSPTWTLKYFRGPSGGGGGSGGSSGAGSSGSGSGGGSQGLIGANRTAKDQLLIAFTGRCDSFRKQGEKPNNEDPKSYYTWLDGCLEQSSTHTLLELKLRPELAVPNDATTERALQSLQNATNATILQSLSSSLR